MSSAQERHYLNGGYMMKTIKRITTSLFANFDWAVTQIENHEALVNAALREIQHAGAKARVQLGRVRQDGDRMKRKLTELSEADALWTERALRCGATDEAKALECLRRKKKANSERLELEAQIAGHARLEENLANDLEAIEKRIEELKRKRNTLRTRESTAEALSAMQSQDAGLIAELDDVLDRWEIKVSTYESSDVGNTCAKALETELENEEEEAALRAELSALQQERQAQKPAK